ncbi:MFS transporter [Deinococcus yavapaiensis]|uniref:Sugar transport protein n=1 Tax=Deinococcus yavapaiensis KR-236 TaxID=694435 RepID=A0A318SFE9_9DEIO|nr:MFS transporter [Deinococcus yavapaiensis]PYE55442.1 sugar transport protein [Deinococcus yavapaiensis KR-236]
MSMSRSFDRRPFFALLVANALSWHGSAVTSLAVPWFVLQGTNSPTLTGVVALCGLLGSAASFALGGPLVDRLGHREASVLADLLSAAAVAAMPALYASGHLSFPLLAALTFARAVLDGPGNTARASLLPDLARQGGLELERANTLGEIAESGAGWTGPLLGGVLIASLGAHAVLWIDAASFVVSAALVAFAVPSNRSPFLVGSRSAAADFWGGWRFLWADGPLRVIFGSSVVFSALMAALFAVVLPVFARGAGGAVGLGAVVSAFGLGSVLGSVAFGRFGHAWSRRTTFLVSVWGLCGIFVALACFADPRVVVAACFLGGLIAGPNGPLIPTVLQERTPDALRARVVAASSALTLVASPLGVLLGGAALERWSFSATLLGMAIVFALGVLSATFDGGLRAVDEPVAR